ncbi:lipid A Kdo2 1-phosphate O-methyltransferase [Helicobacter cinaedi]|uniref:methyltransferase family protein n=1 Tax=Helicobacter cinaedi TaxID=213 RepID=UPI001F48B79B|nr:isoprenylcysteine carboxylmethyltransferase family protein [Helicobacter cinaedi]BDB64532.1 lipid A Kdo2 1-phosphate O-methyltransferase [Helicobacter cinaedi]
MALQEELKTQGDFLFRYRSYLPFCILPLFILVILTSETYLYCDGVYNTSLVIAAIFVGLLGQGVRIWVAGFVPRDTSGRNTREQKASVLNHTGLYSVCRNPLYLGNFLMMLAPIILLGNWLFIVVFALSFWLYYERIIFAEESFLRVKFGQEYIDWTLKTPPFFPKLSGYIPSDMDFSFRSMIRREYNSFFGLTSSLFVFHYIIAVIVNWQRGGGVEFIAPDSILTYLFIVSAVFYLLIRIMVKATKFFEVEGR